MRQFDVFIFDKSFNEADKILPQPPFTDPELEWFYTNDWNKHLNAIEGEWVVFAHPSIRIDRIFLNNIAEITDGFPMVDAFAPRIRTDKGNFLGGYLLKKASKGSGFIAIDENAPLRYVAAPHPFLAIYSRRIIQRTGGFDMDLPAEYRFADYTLRMMHAGGKMFSVPYLVTEATDDKAEQATSMSDLNSIAYILSKSFGIEASLPFALYHPSVIPSLFSHRKSCQKKRKAATLLSKFTTNFQAEITAI